VATVLALAVGLAFLAAGGELLVRGAAQPAARLGISALVVGLTVVAFGTSAPELAVTLQSVSVGAPDLAVGNVVGSNIFNTLVILGASALIVPLLVSRRVTRVEVPLIIGVSLLTWWMASDGTLSLLDGAGLLLVLAIYTLWLLRTSSADDSTQEQGAAPPPALLPSAGLTLAGIVLLVLGARWLVQGAVDVAVAFGVDDAVVGLTILAAGTSLPEVAASIMAAMRGQRDIAVGNVLGSNMFNLTAIQGLTAVAAGGLNVPPGVLTFDLVVMIAAAVACLPFMVTGLQIARWEGALFLAYYVAYTAYLVMDAVGHEALPHLEHALVFFAFPLTAVTVVVLTVRRVRRRRR
jgi:cation:H+ antiporter